MNIRFLPYYLLLICLVNGCKKDKVPGVNSCIEFTPTTSPFGYQYENEEVSYSAPVFNPNNGNEIIFIKGYLSTNQTEIIKYNILTKEETILLQNANVWLRPDWGSNGWILLSRNDSQIWKIKDNGDSLTQLTTQFGFDPVWNPEGDKFIFWKQESSIYYSFISDPLGNIIDTLNYPNIIQRGSWSQDGITVASTFGNGSYFDISTQQLINLSDQFGLSEAVNSVDWLPDSENLILSNNSGVYKLNINSGLMSSMYEACDNKSYVWPSVSPDGNKIVIQRFDKSQINENTIHIESNIYLLNSDGKKEIKIFPN